MFSNSIQKLIDLFSKFPTIGPRTASRFVYYLIKLPNEDFNNFINGLIKLKKEVKICSFCFNPFEGDSDSLCPICGDNLRDRSMLCLVEKENDLLSLEKTKKYKGIYFILGGTFSGTNEKNIRMEELEERIKKMANLKEIIIAVNPTPEGETTALYLERKLKPMPVKITRLGRGLPVGGELEYADEETLESALEGRK